MHPQERRMTKRKATEFLAYLSLPFDNGGFVTDLSAGGLGFQAVAPVKSGRPIHFRFAMDSSTRISAVGELAWIDKTGKNGGLRFTQLSEEVREQIRIWTGQSKPREETRIDVQVAERAIVTTVSASGGANIVREVIASAKAHESPHVMSHANVHDVQITNPVIVAATSRRNNAEIALEVHAITCANPRVVRIEESGGEPFYALPTLPLTPNFKARPNATSIPATFANRMSIARSHPVAAVGVTIALAFLVSMGILVLLSVILEG